MEKAKRANLPSVPGGVGVGSGKRTQKQHGDPDPLSRLSTRSTVSTCFIPDNKYNGDNRQTKKATRRRVKLCYHFWGEEAYYNRYLSFEGEETPEILKLSLGFCFGGHDIRRPLKAIEISNLKGQKENLEEGGVWLVLTYFVGISFQLIAGRGSKGTINLIARLLADEWWRETLLPLRAGTSKAT